MTTIQLKRSTTAGHAPSSLAVGEIAINEADGLLYFRNNAGGVASIQLFINVPQNSKSAAYTLVAADAQKHIYHPSSDSTARTFTIPANSSVAYPIGTEISFVNMSAGNVTIAITSDTMRLAGLGSTGSRTLAQYGEATALKTGTTEWIISGTGLT